MASTSPIGVGIVGYGLAGRSFHAPFIDAVDGLRVDAIVTSDPGRRVQAAREHPGATIVPTVDELLARSAVEIVVVASPNRSHAPLGIRALDSGRHVVVDKPIAMDVPEASSLIERATRTGGILTVFQNRRWDGDARTVRRLIDEDAFGPIDSLESRFERASAVGPEWRESAEEAAGPWRDLGAHLVDQCLGLFGPAERVWAQADRRRPGTQVDDAVFVAIDHAGGVRSRLWTSLIASQVGPRIRVRGLKGEYRKDDLDPQEAQLLAGMHPNDAAFGIEPEERWGTLASTDGTVRRIPTEPGHYIEFYELLRDAVRGDGPPPVDPLDAVRVLRVLEAAEVAAASGTAQSVADA